MRRSLSGEAAALMEQVMAVRYTDVKLEQELCERMLALADHEKDDYCRAFAHTYLGDSYIAQNSTSDCGYHLQKARLLCEENGYNDLLLRVCNLFGICYEALADEQSAVQYYLQGLQLCRNGAGGSMEHLLYNNIAGNFAMLGEDREAKKYYLLACALLEQSDGSDINSGYVKLCAWGNIAEICRRLGEYDEMWDYLLRCEALTDCPPMLQRMILLRSWCGYYTYTGNREKALSAARELLKCCLREKEQDKYRIYELLIDTCQFMIELGDATLARELLNHILGMRRDGEIDRSRQIQKLNTQYCEVFGTEEQRAEAYREYYRVMTTLEERTNASKVSGLKNTLYLDTLKNYLTLEKESLQEEAHLDELTRLYNRRYLRKMSSKAALDPLTHSLGFIMVDVDYFKEFNDAYGHPKADDVLHTVAQTLNGRAFEGISVSRYGGDEFVCLCVNQSEETVQAFIEAVQSALAGLGIEHKASRCSPSLTMSIGYSLRPWPSDMDWENILEEADRALYASKNAGRNTATAFSGGAQAISLRV